MGEAQSECRSVRQSEWGWCRFAGKPRVRDTRRNSADQNRIHCYREGARQDTQEVGLGGGILVRYRHTDLGLETTTLQERCELSVTNKPTMQYRRSH